LYLTYKHNNMELSKLTPQQRQDVGRIEPVTSSEIQISITNNYSLNNLILSGKKVELVTFVGGGQALIIDDVLFKFEIMAYHFDDETDVDTDLSLNQLDIFDATLNSAEIEQIEDEVE